MRNRPTIRLQKLTQPQNKIKMNNQSPLVPQGTLDPKNKGRARVKIAVFFVLAVHGVGLLALLLQGCHREDTTSQASQTATNNALPALEATNPPAVTDSSTLPPPTNQVAAVEQTNQAPVAASEYAVAKGDTYASIAHKFGVSIKAIADANPGVEPTKLQVAQKLHIPAPTKTVVASSTATPAASGSGEQPYTVKSGDTLIRIASVHHVSVRSLRLANNLKTDRITVGQKLKIPMKVAAAATTETASANPTVPPGTPTVR